MSILLRETLLPFSSLYCEVFWNSKKWEDLCSLYCARSKGGRNLGEGLESARIWVKQRKLLCYRFAVFTLFFTFTFVEGALVAILRNLSKNNGDSYENVTEEVKLCCFRLQHAHSVFFNLSNVDNSFLELNSKRLCQSSGKEKQSLVLCSHPPQNVRLGIFVW